MSETILKLENISKTYGSGEAAVHALRSTSLGVQKGEFVAIMGQSGSGKSTLLHIIGLLDRPNHGKVIINGKDSGKMSDKQLAALRGKTIGFIFQSFNLHPTMTAEENVELPMVIMEHSQAERKQRSKELMKLVGLSDRTTHMPSELSGGECQRVAMSRALAMDPEIILADEPTGNLDSKTGHEVMEIIDSINRNGKTVVMITHDDGIASYAKRKVRIKDGAIISDKSIHK